MFAILNLLFVLQGRWQEVGKTGSGNPVFVDAKSVRTGKDGIIVATVRVTYAKPVSVPGRPKPLTASKAAAMFNCTAKTFAVKESWVYFDERSNAIYQHKVNQIPGYGPTIAGSFGDVALIHFCKSRKGA